MRTKLYWDRPIAGTYGNFLGYATLLNSIDEIIERDDNSDIAFVLMDPAKYHRVPNKKVNILLTMWESTDFPRAYIPLIEKADVIITPSRFCQGVFQKFFKAPVHYLPLAVDPVFTYKRRKKPKDNEVFRWLWLNAPDIRKGYQIIGEIWEPLFFKLPNVELYLKTTGNTGETKQWPRMDANKRE